MGPRIPSKEELAQPIEAVYCQALIIAGRRVALAIWHTGDIAFAQNTRACEMWRIAQYIEERRQRARDARWAKSRH